jgi:ubiquitin-protein ligase
MFGGAKGLERLKLEYNEITQGKCLEQVEGFVEIFNSNYFDWKVSFLGPKRTPYEGGLYTIEIKFDNDYPVSKPLCRFITSIWHPNVMTGSGNICLDFIKVWSPNHTILELILNIYSLLVNPNFDSLINNEVNNPDYEIIAREYNEKYAKKYMTIRCVDTRNESIDIIVNRYDTIGKAKEKFFERVGSRQNIEWIYYGDILSDKKTFDYYAIEDLDKIYVQRVYRAG